MEPVGRDSSWWRRWCSSSTSVIIHIAMNAWRKIQPEPLEGSHGSPLTSICQCTSLLSLSPQKAVCGDRDFYCHSWSILRHEYTVVVGISSKSLFLLGALHEGRVFLLHFLGRSGIVISGVMLVSKNVLLSKPENIFHPNGRKMALTLFVVSSCIRVRAEKIL